MAPSPTITLRVNGSDYGGWTTAQITRGIEAIAGSFSLTVSDRWAGASAIREEDECTVLIGQRKVITGYVDRRAIAFSSAEHTLTLTGRDRTGALVDCSVLLSKKWEFKGITVLAFAQKICEPHGIAVSLQEGLTAAQLPAAPKKLSVDPGDTAFSAIETACRLAGLLPVSDGNGALVLTRAGTGRAAVDLVEGQNILSASADFDASGRFRTYTVLGQHRGSDEWFGESAAQIKGTASDLGVTRAARTLIVRPEAGVTLEHAKTRAAWEAATRAARSGVVAVTVQGWLQAEAKPLWPINVLVRVKSPTLGVDGDMLITQATHDASPGGGTSTTLTLKHPAAFKPEALIAASADGTWEELRRGV